jgi:hypothetical protein
MFDSIWEALKQPPFPSDMERANCIFDRMMEKEWAFNSDVEDLIDVLDRRLSYVTFDILEFSKVVGIHWEKICYRPNARTNCVSEYDAIRPSDMAALLIMLERIGFLTSPEFACDKIIPSLKQKTKSFFTQSELDVFWFYKVRHRNAEIFLVSIEKAIFWEESERIKTSLGYTVKLNSTVTGVPVSLGISSPKYRSRRESERTICKECGVEWRKGDPDSSYHHRKEHKRRMKYLNPQPHLKVIEDRKHNPTPELVRYGSPTWKHKEMYLRALAFKREFHYDFIQWKSPKGDSDPYVYGYLFTNEAGMIVGACSFRFRKSESQKNYWALDWVWVCPKERCKGHLSKRWSQFRIQFGDFFVTNPVSDNMKAFLEKRGELHLMDVPE